MARLTRRIAVDKDTHDKWNLIAKIWKKKLSEALEFYADQLLEMYETQGTVKPKEKEENETITKTHRHN